MSAATSSADLDALASRVRAAQHSRSFPLLVIGALLVNYGINDFAPHPIEWRYGAALAFVAVWALGKLNESRLGVGQSTTDYLVAAGFVFTATNLVFLQPVARRLDLMQMDACGVAIVGLALLLLGWRSRAAIVAIVGVGIMATGVTLAIADSKSIFSVSLASPFGAGFGNFQSWPFQWIAIDGAVLTLLGLLLYLRERTYE